MLKNVLFLVTLSAAAQEIQPDRRVTFSLEASHAKEVSIYIYSFTVDGMTIADPVNPRLKLRARTSASLAEVTTDTQLPWQPRDVPHGAVEINWQSKKMSLGVFVGAPNLVGGKRA